MGPPSDRLDSWKEIATHFTRTVRTVQRWERACGMPVHRHGHLRSSSVYASRSELEAWWLTRDGAEGGDSSGEAPARPRPRLQTADVSAEDLFAMARHEWNTRTVDGIRRSVALARQATLRDPGHGASHAMLALAGVVLASYLSEPMQGPIELAREAATRAIEIDERLGDAHTALGLIHLGYDWRWEEAERALPRATTLAPQHATAWSWLGFLHLSRGNLEQALVDTRRAELLDPASLIIKSQVAWVLYFSGRHEEALGHLEETLAIDRSFWRAYMNAAWCHMAIGRTDEAVHALETAVALNDYPLLRTVLASAYARAGREPEARAALADLASSDRHLSSYILVHARLALGEIDEAARLLTRACDDREWLLIFVRVDPGVDELRTHPVYREVVDRIAFSADRRHTETR